MFFLGWISRNSNRFCPKQQQILSKTTKTVVSPRYHVGVDFPKQQQILSKTRMYPGNCSTAVLPQVLPPPPSSSFEFSQAVCSIHPSTHSLTNSTTYHTFVHCTSYLVHTVRISIYLCRVRLVWEQTLVCVRKELIRIVEVTWRRTL